MCNRTDCAGSWAGPMACAVCRERDMSSSCVICNNSMADQFTLHYSEDGWDPPFYFWLCREHQRALIEPVQEAIKKMKEERKCQQ